MPDRWKTTALVGKLQLCKGKTKSEVLPEFLLESSLCITIFCISACSFLKAADMRGGGSKAADTPVHCRNNRIVFTV